MDHLRRSLLVTGLVLLALAGTAEVRADFWASYGTRVEVSPSGAFYAIVDGTAFGGGSGRRPSRVHIVRREVGRPPLTPRRLQTADLPKLGPLGLVEMGDDLVASVDLDQTPFFVNVLDDGRLVLVDSYGSTGHHELVIVVGADGALLHSLDAHDIFEGFGERFWGSMWSIHWEAMSWVDASGNELKIVTVDQAALAIHLDTGRVELRDLAVTLFGRPGPPADRLMRAWEIAREAGLTVHEQALQVAKDEAQPFAVRVRAAASLGMHERETAKALLLAGIQDDDEDTRDWAWRELGPALGPEACPLYRDEILRTPDRPVFHLTEGMAGVGDAAVDPAIDLMLIPGSGVGEMWWIAPRVLLLLESDVATTGQEYAIHGDIWVRKRDAFFRLRDGRDVSALPILLERVEYPPGIVRHGYLVLPALEQVRRRPSPDAARPVADFLRLLHQVPHPMPSWDARLHRTAVAALQACTGLKHGDDPAAWARALGL